MLDGTSDGRVWGNGLTPPNTEVKPNRFASSEAILDPCCVLRQFHPLDEVPRLDEMLCHSVRPPSPEIRPERSSDLASSRRMKRVERV
jgi:hypothetical protein